MKTKHLTLTDKLRLLKDMGIMSEDEMAKCVADLVEINITPLKSLAEYNKEKWEQWLKQQDSMLSHPNGISCPECGAELWDSNPMCRALSYPPQYEITCPSCRYRGYRL